MGWVCARAWAPFSQRLACKTAPETEGSPKALTSSASVATDTWGGLPPGYEAPLCRLGRHSAQAASLGGMPAARAAARPLGASACAPVRGAPGGEGFQTWRRDTALGGGGRAGGGGPCRPALVEEKLALTP